MKKVYLICNAHIDPLWQWNKNEGAAEAISTFRVAADFCEEYDGFIFNHNESLLYEWVEEYEPALFSRIQKLVKAGKWHIMGGWYLQPDCVMPSGESFIAQIETGRRYFEEKFGVSPSTALNFDSFGHTRGLVQILKKTGFDSYLFTRTGYNFGYGLFRWEGFDGSVISAYREVAYGTNRGKAIEKIKNAIDNSQDDRFLILWGIGDHGGGPSRIDLETINGFLSETEHDVCHSTPEDYFKEVHAEALDASFDKSLVHTMVGCYTSMVRIKQAHRRVENKLKMCEIMLSDSGVEYDKNEWEAAKKAFLFTEFHDVLPGSCVKSGEDEALRMLSFAENICDNNMLKAYFVLCRGQKKAKDGEIPILVYNPMPNEITKTVEVEFQLGDQNWNESETSVVKIRDAGGNYLPVQNEKEAGSIPLDWRIKIAFTATLAPMSVTRFDCELHPTENYEKIAPYDEDDKNIFVTTDTLSVTISKKTGLLDKYSVNGKDLLSSPSGKIKVCNDNEDAWGMLRRGFYPKTGEFEFLSSTEAKAFRGFTDGKDENLLVIENGPVRLITEGIFRYMNSYAVIRYTVSKQDNYVDVNVRMFSNDAIKMYKLCFNSTNKGQLLGQTAFGTQELENDDTEFCYHKWLGFDKGLCILNKGTYGGSSDNGEIRISLLRTPVYTGHPIYDRPIARRDRFNDHIDMGERVFDFRLIPYSDGIDLLAEDFNLSSYTLAFFPAGEGEKVSHNVVLDSATVLLSSYRRDKNRILVRFYNTQNTENTASVKVDGVNITMEFTPYEVKTYVIENGNIKETDMLGR